MGSKAAWALALYSRIVNLDSSSKERKQLWDIFGKLELDVVVTSTVPSVYLGEFEEFFSDVRKIFQKLLRHLIRISCVIWYS
jgi:hypothetical protein